MIRKAVFGFGVAMTVLLTGTVLWFWAHDMVGDHSQSVALQKAVQPYLTPRRASFSLFDHTGQPVTEQTYQGRMLLVYFGYTECTDVCPYDLAAVSGALDQLGETMAAKVQPVFVTIDPDVDTPALLARYRKLFHPSLAALTGTKSQIAAAARAFGTSTEKEPPAPFSPHDHTANLFLINAKGDFLRVIRTPTTPNDLASIIRLYL
jgi:protein SCO1/2